MTTQTSPMHLLPGKTCYERLMTFVASGFCIGIVAPFASGTWGSAPGVALAYATTLLPWWWQIAACLVLAAAAVPVCGVAERVFDRKDDGRIVADEWMLYPIGVIGLPIAGAPWWHMAVYFVVIRFFDIVKLPPANRLQSISGGLGVVVDDFAANLYSLGANWLLYTFWLKGCVS